MAAPVNSSYTVAAGQPIYAGRLRSGFSAVAVALAGLVAGGTLLSAGFSGGATLGGVSAGGELYRGIAMQNALIDIEGQSNALGIAPRADISAAPLSSDAGLAVFDAGTFDRVFIWNGAAMVQLKMGTNNAASASTTFGPEFGLAVRWMRETTAGNLYLIKEATGGASITNWETYLYDDMITRHLAALAWLASNSIAITTNAFLWVQGEADASETQAWYETRMQDLIDNRVADGCMGASDLSLLGQIPTGTLGYGAGVAAAKVAIASASPSTVEVLPYSTHYLGDNLHMSARGQVQFGYDAFEQIFGVAHITV